ncbi:MAG: tetratricopeptide repeat protein [Aggregatilineales bacterium]
MQIKRDYSQPFFGEGRNQRNRVKSVFYFLTFIGLTLALVYVNFDRLQGMAMEVAGTAPTATPFPSELATRATSLELAGDLTGAAQLWESVLRQRPDDIDYLFEYGQLLIDLTDYDFARQLADRIIELNRTDPRGYSLKALALEFDGSSSEAVTVAVTGLDYDPNYAPLQAALARSYVGVARYADAVDAGFRAVELSPYDADMRRAYAYALNWFGENLDATTQLEQAVSLDPNRIPTYFELAFQYLAQNRDQEAIDIYTRILSIQPRNARAMLRLCVAYRKIGEFQRALGQCADAVEVVEPTDPIASDAYFEYGRMLYNENRDWAGALQAFETCSEYAPESLSCNYYQGLTHYYMGDCDTAWNILRDSLVIARSRQGTDAIVVDIEAGFNAIAQTCPGYAGLVSGLDLGSSGSTEPPVQDIGGS